MITDVGQRRAFHISDAGGQGACGACDREGLNDIGSLSGLGDAQDEASRQVGRGIIEGVDRRGSEGHGNADDNLEEILGIGGGMVGSSACGDDDKADVAFAKGLDKTADRSMFLLDRLCNGLRLFIDLFLHQRHKCAFLT